MSNIKKIVLTALSIALCVVLPMAFHAIPKGGMIYLPMHIPVLLGALIVGPIYGGAIGILGPLFSSLLTGMPATAMLPAMMVELAVYGIVSGLMMKFIKSKYLYLDLYISLVVAMLSGRIIAGCAKALIFSAGKYSMTAWATGYFVTGLPGIIIQLAVIPTLYFALYKAKLITRD